MLQCYIYFRVQNLFVTKQVGIVSDRIKTIYSLEFSLYDLWKFEGKLGRIIMEMELQGEL